MFIRFARALLALCVFLVCLIALPAAAARKTPLQGTSPARLLEVARQNGQMTVIVGVRLNKPWTPEGRLTPASAKAQRAEMKAKKEALLRRYPRVKLLGRHEWTAIPFCAIGVDETALQQLLRDDAISSVEESVVYRMALDENVAKIGATAPALTDRNIDGSNQAIAILDTGVDYNHPFLRPRVLTDRAACFSYQGVGPAKPNSTDPPTDDPGDDAYNLYESLCTAPNIASPCDTSLAWSNRRNNCGHGTRVAGVAAGLNQSPELSGPARGVAPAAKIIPISIVSRHVVRAAGYDDGDDPSNPNDTTNPDYMLESRTEEMLDALNYVLNTLAPLYSRKIDTPRGVETRSTLVVNISFALKLMNSGPDDQTASGCSDDFPSLVAVVDSLAAVDIPVVAGSGNDGARRYISSPACIPNVIAAAATNDDDTVAWYSNVTQWADFFAPGGSSRSGTMTVTSEPEALEPDGWFEDAGTSLASPAVAGAIALIRESDPEASFPAIVNRLTATGIMVQDDRNPNVAIADRVRKPRIQVDAAVNACAYELWGTVTETEWVEADQAGMRPADTVRTNIYRHSLGSNPIITVELIKHRGVLTNVYQWDYPTSLQLISDNGDRKSFRVINFDAKQTFRITVTAAGTTTAGGSYSCERSILFRVEPPPTFSVTAGQCDPVKDPTLEGFLYTHWTVRTALKNSAGDVIDDNAGYSYVWRLNGEQKHSGTGNSGATYGYTVTEMGEKKFELTVTAPDGSKATTTITFKATGTYESCTATSPCARGCGKQRSVRRGGVAITFYSFTPGENVTLQVPVEIPGATYEWHRRLSSGLDEVIGTGPTITFVAVEAARYYVVTKTSNAEEVSEDVTLAADAGSSNRVTVTPLEQTIGGSGTAWLEASFQPDAGALAMYEWREGNTYDTTAPVIGEGPTFTPRPPDHVVYWVRVVHRKPDPVDPTRTITEYLNSKFASVTVNCTETVGGVAIVRPSSRVARNQRPTIAVAPQGKQLTYTWYRRLPSETTGSVTGSWWNSITPGVTAPVTYFRADVVDVCGTTGSTNEVAVYLCVPTITTQPVANKIVQAGETFTLSVAATPAIDGQPLTITWHSAADPYQQTVLGTGTTFTTSIPAGTSTRSYYAAIKSDCSGSINTLKSITAKVDVCTPATLYGNHDSSTNITAGESKILGLSASGTDLTYQWYVGVKGDTSNPMTGKTTASITVSPTSDTSYWCRVVSQGTCPVDGPTNTLRVCRVPTITTHPISTNVFSNSTATLTVAVDNGTNTQTPQYQWYEQTATTTAKITGATAATYTTPPVTAEKTYLATITVGDCEVTSNAATIGVCSYNQVLSTGSDRNVGYGESTTLNFPVLSPVLVKEIRWYRGPSGTKTQLVASGTATSLNYTTPALTANGQYWFEFTHNGCVSRSTTYNVYVCKPGITTQPVGKTIASGTSTTLSVATSALAGQTFQWYTGTPGTITNPVAGGTTATITVSPTATTSYWVRVTGTCSTAASVDSTAATITVCTPPSISSTPGTIAKQSGQSSTLNLIATGSNLTYQWYVGASGTTTNPINGATSQSITISPTSTTSYWCRVTSEGTCVTNSAAWTIDVCTSPSITTQPLSQRIFSGGTTTLTVAATSSRALTYQWYIGAPGDTSAPISGATGASVTVSPAVETTYWVRVNASVCSIDSAPATVSHCTYNEVINTGSVRNIGYNESTTLPFPTMSPVEVKEIRWYRGASGVKTQLVASGTATSLNYTTPALTANAQYWFEFTHNGCVSRSSTYNVYVCKPGIATQPVGKTIASGSSATLTVGTTALAGQTFQWYIGTPGTTTSPIAGATAATLTVSPTATTSYWVRVTGTCSTAVTVDSAAAVVNVCTPPQILTTPGTISREAGQSATLNVSASGTNLTYQWYVGASGTTTSPIANATSQSITVSPNTTTSYWCRVVSDGTCVTNSAAWTIDVCTAPAITAQPQSQRIFSGTSATLAVTASSSRTLSYQWYIGLTGDTTSKITGATSATLTVTPAAETNYWVRITTGACVVDSATATVSLCTYPSQVNAAVAQTNIASGQTATLSLPGMSPTETKSITWYRGATGDKTTAVLSGTGVNLSYTTPALTTTTQYWAEFTHNGCISRTTTYTVAVCKPTITAQPQSAIILSGNSSTLSVTATGAPLSYQWYIGATGDLSNPISGATSSSYTTPALTVTTSYWVRVSGCTAADSATATVTVCQAPAVTNISKSGSDLYGANATLTVTATGTSLTYQWFKGQSGNTTQPISGATSATYTFSATYGEYYWARVTSGCNGATANSAAIYYSVDPLVTAPPQSVSIPSGTSTTLSVTATGRDLTYQWHTGLPNYGPAITGATGQTYTTPALTAETKYWVRVASANQSFVASEGATVSICAAPDITSYSSTSIGTNSWRLTVAVSQESFDRGVEYHWYNGPRSNPSASAYLGSGTNYKSFYSVTQQMTVWVRVVYQDGSCYADTSTKTLTPQ